MASLSLEELDEIRQKFDKLDLDRNGHITTQELSDVFRQVSESFPAYKIRDMIREVDMDENGTVEFDEFVALFKKTKIRDLAYRLIHLAATAERESGAGVIHRVSDEEKVAFVDFMNFRLAKVSILRQYLPIRQDTDDLFNKVRDGVLLCSLIDAVNPEWLDMRCVHKGHLNLFTKKQNATLAVNSSRALGVPNVNIGADDILRGTRHLVLGLISQIIYVGFTRRIRPANYPDLVRLLTAEENFDDLLSMTLEETLMRWVNYQLQRAGNSRRIANFGSDIADSEAYCVLLRQVAPAGSGVDEVDLSAAPLMKAESMLKQADKIGCRLFVTAQDVVRGKKKLNLLFVANIFVTFPALEPAAIDYRDVFQATQEEKTFVNWMNSIGAHPRVNWLFTDLRNGLIMLQMLDKIQPGIVDWSKVHGQVALKAAGRRAIQLRLENCNYVLERCRAQKYSVVGIGGKDILDGNKTFTQAVVWQMMRSYLFMLLEKLMGHGRPITDKEIIKLVNAKLAETGKVSRISSFKDPAISDSRPILEYLDAITQAQGGTVDWSLVSAGNSNEEKLANAKYAISLAWKTGVRVYARPEDIVEVKPNMALTIFVALFIAMRQMTNR